MRDRCNNPNCRAYKNYGGRGIAICPEWDDFAIFRDWALEKGYDSNLTIERIDNDGPYSPQNCRWATRKEQAQNRRGNIMVTFNDESMTLAEASRASGIAYNLLQYRYHANGEQGLFKPVRDGMVLVNGTVRPGVGGGLCQLSNLIFWMTIHTPLTVVERHRHGYDVFPDSNRTQPFGSGATCFYPYGDLMIRNDTPHTYQLCARVGAKNLEGEWRISSPPEHRFEIVEKNHEMRGEYWGGFTRHNELYQRKYSLSGDLLSERLITRNTAIMMYSPFLEGET
jgi:hypothetical protein